MFLAIAPLQLNCFNTCIMRNKNENESENKAPARHAQREIYRSIFENILFLNAWNMLHVSVKRKWAPYDSQAAGDFLPIPVS